jgi:hypothetical protein
VLCSLSRDRPIVKAFLPLHSSPSSPPRSDSSRLDTNLDHDQGRLWDPLPRAWLEGPRAEGVGVPRARGLTARCPVRGRNARGSASGRWSPSSVVSMCSYCVSRFPEAPCVHSSGTSTCGSRRGRGTVGLSAERRCTVDATHVRTTRMTLAGGDTTQRNGPADPSYAPCAVLEVWPSRYALSARHHVVHAYTGRGTTRSVPGQSRVAHALPKTATGTLAAARRWEHTLESR